MGIVNYVNIAHPQNGGLWCKIGIKTNEHSCSELLSKICGIKQNPFTMENFMLMLHSDYRNKLLRQISTSFKIGASGERFSFLTKSVCHWTRNIPDLLDDNNPESQSYGYEDAYNGRSGSYSKDTGDDRHSLIMLAAFVYDDDRRSNKVRMLRLYDKAYSGK